MHVRRPGFGFLSYDPQTIARLFPQAYENVDRLVEQNYRDSGIFVSAQEVDQECDDRMQQILTERIIVNPRNTRKGIMQPVNGGSDPIVQETESDVASPFE